MPTKKKKFNARFPPARIKKIMQTDDDVGKVAAPVPVIISKALEMFLHTLVEKTCSYTQARNAKTLTTAHIKKCINSEQQFDFLKDLVEKIPNLPDNEEDVDGEAKPKRRKQSTANKDKDKPRKKRKSKKEEETLTMSDESDNDQEEEDHESDDEASVSSESHSYQQSSMNTNNVSASISPNNTNLPSITITKAEKNNDEVFEPSASGLPQTCNHSVLPNACKSIEEEDDDYDS